MPSVRSTPYVWVTSIAPFLAGQAFCEYRPWFIARHQGFERQPSSFNGAAWRAKHAELVRKTAAWQREVNTTVLVEAQNRFLLSGKSGTVVAGQPDLVRLRTTGALVTDCKTGQPLDAHVGQVLCYMLLLPYTRPEYRQQSFSGRIQYEDYALDLPASAVSDEFREQFRRTLGMIEREEAPVPAASQWECRYCPLTSQDCPERVDARSEGSETALALDLF
jgi:hypothetical protein